MHALIQVRVLELNPQSTHGPAASGCTQCSPVCARQGVTKPDAVQHLAACRVPHAHSNHALADEGGVLIPTYTFDDSVVMHVCTSGS